MFVILAPLIAPIVVFAVVIFLSQGKRLLLAGTCTFAAAILLYQFSYQATLATSPATWLAGLAQAIAVSLVFYASLLLPTTLSCLRHHPHRLIIAVINVAVPVFWWLYGLRTGSLALEWLPWKPLYPETAMLLVADPIIPVPVVPLGWLIALVWAAWPLRRPPQAATK